MSMKIALAGNPNCGKTTLFNALTGSNQFVGNWPGVTVEKKEGKLKGHKDVVIMDLPGIYSLSPYTLEEVVARNYLIGERPDVILNIVDGTNLERNLYLSTQLMELGIPVVMAINMMDLVQKNGDKIHIKKLSQKLGCPVVEISALKGTGIKEASEQAVRLAQSRGSAEPVHEFSPQLESVLNSIEDKLSLDVPQEQRRFFAIKLLEKDSKIQAQMQRVPDVTEEINAFDKLKFEAQFQKLSPGGAISYVEVPDMKDNLSAVLAVMKHIYENIMYAELNTKSDYCSICGYDGEIQVVTDEHGKLAWECPNCKNRNQNTMSVARRTCGYIGTQYWNQGRTQEIKERVLHL